MQTAQLRLENATLSRRSQLAEQRAKIFQGERNNLAKMVDGLRKELDAIRQQNVQGSPDCGTESFTSGNHTSGLCNMVSSFICCSIHLVLFGFFQRGLFTSKLNIRLRKALPYANIYSPKQVVALTLWTKDTIFYNSGRRRRSFSSRRCEA